MYVYCVYPVMSNVCIFCISCNVKCPTHLPNFTAKSKNKCQFNLFHDDHRPTAIQTNFDT